MPTGPNTDSLETVSTYILNAIQENATSFSTPVQDVYYGDQTLLPQTPAICVVPSRKTREFQGASLRTLNLFEVLLYVYFSKITDVQSNIHGCTALADGVETFLHADQTLGGNVISTLCVDNEPGIAIKQGGLVATSRLLVRCQSKTFLLPA